MDYRALYSHQPTEQQAQWLNRWQLETDRWLSRYSANTRITYRRALSDWYAFLDCQFNMTYPWLATAEHAAAWLRHMQQHGSSGVADRRPLSAATICNRMAAVSSLYQYLGEQELFVDAAGAPRTNPFAAVSRPKPESEQPPSIRPGTMARILHHLASKDEPTLGDRRDYAFLLTAYHTGWRTGDLIRMRWGDIQCAPGGNGIIVHLASGRQGLLPGSCYLAILAYLEADGRLDTMEPADYIWQPIHLRGAANFGLDVADLEVNRHISHSTANEILRRQLRHHYVRILRSKDRLEPESIKKMAREWAARYHLPSLRRSLAKQLYLATGDLTQVAQRLNHAHTGITRSYLKSKQ